jgi:uncharacterized membrane protein
LRQWGIIPMRSLPIVLAAVIILGACTTTQQITLPDGSTGQLVRCGGIQHSMADCYAMAGQVCPRGYDIVDERGEAHPFIVSGQYSTIGGTSIHRTLMVRCH